MCTLLRYGVASPNNVPENMKGVRALRGLWALELHPAGYPSLTVPAKNQSHCPTRAKGTRPVLRIPAAN